MPPVEIYLDDCMPSEVARYLTDAGVAVHRPQQVGTAQATDSGHLMRCMRAGWVLVTQNRRDFRRLHWLWTALYDWGLLAKPHSGILTIHEQLPAGNRLWAAAIAQFLGQEPNLQGRMYRWRPASGRWDEEPARLM